MAFAEEFEKNKKLFIGVGVMVLIALVVLVTTLTGGPSRPKGVNTKAQLFYTVDDGKTYFVDDANHLSPFDHEGKQAYRVQVFQCGTDKPFVGYIQRVEDGARKEAEAAQKQGRTPKEVQAIWADRIEVKKPGEAKWQPVGKADKVLLVTCPDGKTAPTIVLP